MDVNESDKMSSSFSAFSGFYAFRLVDMPLQSVSALCVTLGLLQSQAVVSKSLS